MEATLRTDWEDFKGAVERFREEVAGTDTDVEYSEVQISRVREGLRSRELKMRASRAFADNLFIIGLWASVEQFVGTTLREAEAIKMRREAAVPHSWPQLEERLAELGVKLGECASFASANECRVLNNKIKHVGFVDAQLGGFPALQGKVGTALDDVELELQRYSDGVFEFVGDVMERTDETLATG